MEFDPLFKVEVYSHFFKIIRPTHRSLNAIFSFCYKFTQRTWVREPGQKPAFKPTHLFGSKVKGHHEFRFHSGLLSDFQDHMERHGIGRNLYQVVHAPLYEAKDISVKLNPKYVLRPVQEQAKLHIINPDIASRSRLIKFAMGQGKTLTSLATCAEIGKRVAVVILPTYMEKWGEDITGTLDATYKDIMTVQGADQLRGLMSLAEDNEYNSKFVIISMSTLQNFYKLYESVGEDVLDMGYPFLPDELFQKLGIGTVIIDETHQHINSVYRTMMYAHVPKLIALSATLLTQDPVVASVHTAMYPPEACFEGEKMSKYIRLYPVEYNFKDYNPWKIKTTEFGSNNYSHNAFEKCIMRSHNLKQAYYRMIQHYIELGYMQDRKPGDKLIVFASTIAMCTDLTNHLKNVYKNLDVRRYVEDDPYENVIDADIRVTTVLSAGTGVDIPNLTCAIQTVSISSQVSNLQSFGRLRELKDRTVKFYYFYCRQIPKQVEYHQKRLELFRERVATTKDSPYTQMLF